MGLTSAGHQEIDRQAALHRWNRALSVVTSSDVVPRRLAGRA
jgi:hypothetical protein